MEAADSCADDLRGFVLALLGVRSGFNLGDGLCISSRCAVGAPGVTDLKYRSMKIYCRQLRLGAMRSPGKLEIRPQA